MNTQILKNKKLIRIGIPAMLGLATGIAIYRATNAKIPKGAKPVEDFEIDKYLGKWYEVARLDTRFERFLNNVTSTFSKKEDGTIEVENRGYNYLDKVWNAKTAEVRLASKPDIGRLKVSFFKPVWAGYNILALDSDYHYALVAGNSLDSLWILSRESTIPDKVKNDFMVLADSIGYDTANLLWVMHDKEP